jgi:hypothetical protein
MAAAGLTDKTGRNALGESIYKVETLRVQSEGPRRLPLFAPIGILNELHSRVVREYAQQLR